MLFTNLNLSTPILDAVTQEGYTTPTPIQAQAIPPAMEGRDLLGCAQTGTGKTAAFALPILHRLTNMPIDKSKRGPALARALILSPTRELATQIAESFKTYGKNTTISGTTIYGGVSQHHQVKALQRGIDVIVATPGRLMDLMEQGYVDLTGIKVLVLDEADRMLDMGFIQPIRRICAALPKTRQTLLFSATMPREIMHLADSLLTNPVKVSVAHDVATTELIDQSVYMVSRYSKQALLRHMIEEGNIQRAVVFTRTKHGADKVSDKLNAAGITAAAIHGNKAQNMRDRVLAGFKTGRSRVLVATDVAARGLDVDAITHVFNFDLPNEPEAYVHRIGRTGRAGAKGHAISFCDGEERSFLRAIERLTKNKIPAITELPVLPPEPKRDHTADRDENRGWGNERPQRTGLRGNYNDRSARGQDNRGQDSRGYGSRDSVVSDAIRDQANQGNSRPAHRPTRPVAPHSHGSAPAPHHGGLNGRPAARTNNRPAPRTGKGIKPSSRN